MGEHYHTDVPAAKQRDITFQSSSKPEGPETEKKKNSVYQFRNSNSDRMIFSNS